MILPFPFVLFFLTLKVIGLLLVCCWCVLEARGLLLLLLLFTFGLGQVHEEVGLLLWPSWWFLIEDWHFTKEWGPQTLWLLLISRLILTKLKVDINKWAFRCSSRLLDSCKVESFEINFKLFTSFTWSHFPCLLVNKPCFFLLFQEVGLHERLHCPMPSMAMANQPVLLVQEALHSLRRRILFSRVESAPHNDDDEQQERKLFIKGKATTNKNWWRLQP